MLPTEIKFSTFFVVLFIHISEHLPDIFFFLMIHDKSRVLFHSTAFTNTRMYSAGAGEWLERDDNTKDHKGKPFFVSIWCPIKTLCLEVFHINVDFT